MPSQAAKKAPVPSSAVALFARNFFKYPSMLGSIVPSSPFLVKDIMAQVDWDRARVLVEIELNADFVEYLKSTIPDPRLRVIHGSAAHVRCILSEQGLAPADYII